MNSSNKLKMSNLGLNRQRIRAACCAATGVILALILTAYGVLHAEPAPAPKNLEVAQHDSQGRLLKPDNFDQWVHMGSNIGQGYNTEHSAFEGPGTFRIVEMEPSAYEYYKQHGEYADGTLFSLSIFRPEAKTEPDLNGYSQGEALLIEFHRIDNSLESGRQFYAMQPSADFAEPLTAQQVCVDCHNQEGQFASTFAQFYPKISRRDRAE